MFAVLLLLALSGALRASELHEAARTCDTRTLTTLIAGGVAVNQTTEGGDSPLHIAARNGKPQCIYLLLSAGANKYPWNYRRETAESLALNYERGPIRDGMLALFNSPAFRPGDSLDAALQRAVLRNERELTALFVEMGANPNALGDDGNTPLHNACLKELEAVAELLLTGGADPARHSASGSQPLHDAAVGGDVRIIRLLLQHGAGVDARTRQTGETPLHFAAAWNRVDAAKTLLAAGAKADVRDAKRRTPLDVAGANGNNEVVALLTAAGAPQ